ncbi:hypothetical protein EniLVp02_0210 [Vibrio phage EniLVp02]
METHMKKTDVATAVIRQYPILLPMTVNYQQFTGIINQVDEAVMPSVPMCPLYPPPLFLKQETINHAY